MLCSEILQNRRPHLLDLGLQHTGVVVALGWVSFLDGIAHRHQKMTINRLLVPSASYPVAVGK